MLSSYYKVTSISRKIKHSTPNYNYEGKNENTNECIIEKR